MIKRLIIPFMALLLAAVSCNDKPVPYPGENEQTILIYMPWSGDLTDAFRVNIEEFKAAISTGILRRERVLVYFNDSPSEATLYELKYGKGGKCVEETLKEYTDHPFTTAAGITSLLQDMKRLAPAKRYSLIVGCHGMGWIPVDPTRAVSGGEKEYWEHNGVPQTRWFGGASVAHRTDITTLSKGIADAGIKMEYIMFDDCYMSTVEVAYELKEVTDHLVASPNEIMKRGMPYDRMALYLVGKIDYEALCREFHEFYSVYDVMPCGTIAVTVCGELEKLAGVMKEINTAFEFDRSLRETLQVMDGYDETRFFDFGDYVEKLCPDEKLLAKFNAQLERTVPGDYRRHTEYFYTMSRGKIRIDTFSGLTVSDPSVSPSTRKKTGTAWYKATNIE